MYVCMYICMYGTSSWGCSSGLSVRKISHRAQTTKTTKMQTNNTIVTFNVRTLNRIGQLPELTASAVEHKIDIICIQEHRYTHTEDIKYHETGNRWMLAPVPAWKNSVNATVGGVGMLIGPRALKHLIPLKEYNLGCWQLRLMSTPEQQSSPATALPMLAKKLNKSPSTMSYPL